MSASRLLLVAALGSALACKHAGPESRPVTAAPQAPERTAKDGEVPRAGDVTLSASPARHIAAADACGGGHLTALGLLPSAATVVGGVDVRGIVQLPAYARHRASIEMGELARVLTVAAACDVGVGAMQTVTFALDAPGSNVAAVLRVAGLGSPERLECIRGHMVASGADEPFTLGTDAGMPSLVFAGGGRGWVVDRCTVVVATGGWLEPTRARLAGQGASLLAGDLSPAVVRAGERRHVWAAGKSHMNTLLPGPFATAQDFAMSLDLHAGFVLDVSIRFPDAQQASAAAATMRAQLDGMRGMLPSIGMPQSVADSLGSSASDRITTVHAHGDAQAVDAIFAAVDKAAGVSTPRP